MTARRGLRALVDESELLRDRIARILDLARTYHPGGVPETTGGKAVH